MQDKNEIEYSDIDPELAQIIENKLQMPCNNKTKIQGIVSGVLFLMFIILCYTPVKDFIKNLGIDMFIVVLVIFFIVFALVFVPIHCCVKDKIILFENESLIQIDAQFKTNTVADDEMIIWQEDGR